MHGALALIGRPGAKHNAARWRRSYRHTAMHSLDAPVRPTDFEPLDRCRVHCARTAHRRLFSHTTLAARSARRSRATTCPRSRTPRSTGDPPSAAARRPTARSCAEVCTRVFYYTRLALACRAPPAAWLRVILGGFFGPPQQIR
jgi:hypothetical protein